MGRCLAVGVSIFAAMMSLGLGGCASTGADALPSWNDGPSKRAIVGFVERVSDPHSTEFVPENERVATFDNDGCLWAEKPVYFQLLFALDRVRAMAPDHPEWRSQEPFASALAGDMEGLAAQGEHGILELVMATHSGMTTDEFNAAVREWLRTARHPKTGRAYTEMVYAPMLELLDYLRDNGFEVYIVSGGGIDFLRIWAESVYGVPPQNVVGSSIKTSYAVRDGEPVLERQAELNFIDDKAGKPVGIHSHIGKRPVFACGNSDGDFQMLEWTTAGEGARMGMLVHHTDGRREWAYDRESSVGRLDRGLDEGPGRGWVIIDMASEWSRVWTWE